MKPKHIFILFAIIALLFILFYTFLEDDSKGNYTQHILSLREETDRFMKTSEESPFARRDFKGLKYFPPDEKYRIMATIIPVENKKTILLSTSDHQNRQYLEYAYAEFNLDNRQNRLLLLEEIEGENQGGLFLPFGDETSAVETYGAGRYLDVEKKPGSRSIELDFNKAYNPYCAYSDKYSCPFPPPENLLSIPILAGEKSYK